MKRITVHEERVLKVTVWDRFWWNVVLAQSHPTYTPPYVLHIVPPLCIHIGIQNQKEGKEKRRKESEKGRGKGERKEGKEGKEEKCYAKK
jgi:hypothetical protein